MDISLLMMKRFIRLSYRGTLIKIIFKSTVIVQSKRITRKLIQTKRNLYISIKGYTTDQNGYP